MTIIPCIWHNTQLNELVNNSGPKNFSILEALIYKFTINIDNDIRHINNTQIN